MLINQKQALINILVLSIFLLTLIFFYQSYSIVNYPFHADENDYVQSIEQGFTKNYLDSEAPGARVYLVDAYQSFANNQQIDTFQKYQNSIHNLRHYHGIVGFYPFIIAKSIFKTIDLRIVPIVLIMFFATYWILRNSIQSITQKTIFILLVVLLLTYGQLNFLVSPHLSYIFLALIFLKLIVEEYSRYQRIITLTILTLTLTALEFAAILPLVWIVTAWQVGDLKCNLSLIKSHSVTLFKYLGIIFLVLLIIWPAGVIKLAMPLSYLVYGALALKSNWYQFYESLLFQDMLLTLLIISSLLASLVTITFWKKINLSKFYLGFAWYVLLIFIINLLNNFVYKVYLIQTIIPGLIVLQGTLGWSGQRSKISYYTNYFLSTGLIILLIPAVSNSVLSYHKAMVESRKLLSEVESKYGKEELVIIGYTPNLTKVNMPNVLIEVYPEFKNDQFLCEDSLLSNLKKFIFLMPLSELEKSISCLDRFQVLENRKNLVIISKLSQ